MIHQRTAHGSWYESRDWERIKCKAVGCMFNINEECATPSRAKISNDGKCEGFTIKPLPPKTGD